jgi:hypothetical protein
VSKDDGAVWDPMGLGGKDVRAITENSRYIFASVFNDGVYRMQKQAASVSEGRWERIDTQDALVLEAVPNPSSGRSIIRFIMANAAHATVKLFDARGEELQTLLDTVVSTGEHQVEWNSALPDGLYFCVLQSGRSRSVMKVIRNGR